ncbi:hypothetical protein BTT_60480 (plasmid) [Bacillus thuringiensis serovar morrisoni str. 4AA1]|nr:hypothetical protein BTT_60480 [Bacillus thuringiensis serovar morrisoni str. 4AA1]
MDYFKVNKKTERKISVFFYLALFVAKDENKYLKSLLFSMFMTMLLIKVGGY